MENQENLPILNNFITSHQNHTDNFQDPACNINNELGTEDPGKALDRLELFYSASDITVQTDDSLVENIQYRSINTNPYKKSCQSHASNTNDSIIVNRVNRPEIWSFEDSIYQNNSIKMSESHQPFMDRTLHSINVEVNSAFVNHQKSFKRKNRAVDWILKQTIPDVQQTKDNLYTKLREQYESPNNNEAQAEFRATISNNSSSQTESILTHEYWGDNLDCEKQRTHTRLFFQNVRGLQTSKHNRQDKWLTILEHANRQSFDIFGLAETCTNTTRHRIRHLLQTTAHKVFLQTNVCWANNDFVTDTNYRPGGTVLTTTNSWVGRILYPLHDPHLMGRWSGNAYKLGQDKKLFLFSAYRVCKQSSELGLISSYRQQVLKLQQRYPFTPNLCPRRYFIQDFISYIKSLVITPNDYIIVMIDANEQLGEDYQGITTMMEKLGLIDTFTRHHQRPCEISTHHSSANKRIDFILSTANLMPHIEACGYTPFYTNVDTDHRGLFLELKPSFIDGQARITKPPSRLVGRTTSKAELAKYKEQLLAYFQQVQIPERAEALYNTAKSKEFTADDLRHLNTLDDEITALMLQTEQETCSAKPSFPWSPGMHRAALLIRYWTMKYRNRKNSYDITEQLAQVYEQLSEQQQRAIDTTKAGARYNLHKAKIDKQILQMQSMTHRREARLQRIQHEADYRETTSSHEKQRFAMIDETHHLFRYLEKLYGKKRSLGISGIDIPFRDKFGNLTNDPTQAETWMKIHDPDEIVRRLLQRNIQHFGQAQGSAFTVDPIANTFGFKGTGTSAEDLIHNDMS